MCCLCVCFVFFFKQKTAYEMRISDWSSDVCSSDLAVGAGEGVWMGLRYMAVAGIIINLVLMVLNLIPLPPLDGGRVLTGLLPPRAAFQFAKLERYGLFILLGLIMIPGLLGAIMYWPLAIAEFSLYSLLGLDASTAERKSTRLNSSHQCASR